MGLVVKNFNELSHYTVYLYDRTDKTYILFVYYFSINKIFFGIRVCNKFFAPGKKLPHKVKIHLNVQIVNMLQWISYICIINPGPGTLNNNFKVSSPKSILHYCKIRCLRTSMSKISEAVWKSKHSWSWFLRCFRSHLTCSLNKLKSELGPT